MNGEVTQCGMFEWLDGWMVSGVWIYRDADADDDDDDDGDGDSIDDDDNWNAGGEMSWKMDGVNGMN